MFEASITKTSRKNKTKTVLSTTLILITATLLTLLGAVLIWSQEITAMMHGSPAGSSSTSLIFALIKTVLLLLVAVPLTSYAINTWVAVQESHSFFERLFSDSSESIFLYALDGRILDCNPAFCELLGYAHEALLQMRLPDLLSADSQQLTDTFKTSESGLHEQRRLLMKTRSGETLVVQAHEQRVRVKGKVQRLAFLQNITERHKEEYKRKTLGSITSKLLSVNDTQQGYRELCAELVQCCGSLVVLLVEVDLAYQQLRVLLEDGVPSLLEDVRGRMQEAYKENGGAIDLADCQRKWFVQEQITLYDCPADQFPAHLFAGSEFVPRGIYARQIMAEQNVITSLLILDFKGTFDLLFAESMLNFFSTALLRLRMEEHLNQNQLQLAETQQLVKVGRFQYDYRTRRSLFSDELCQIFGLPAESDDFALIKAIHPEDRPAFAQLLDDTIQNPTGEQFRFNFRINHPDGRLHFMRSQGLIHYGADGKAEYLLTAIHDATELIEARTQLKESQTRYEMVLENSPSLIMVLGLDMKIKYCNWGLGAEKRPEELLGMEIYEFIDSSARGRAVDAFKTAIHTKKIVNLELPVTHFKEDVRQMLVNISPVLINDEVTELILNVADISDKMRMEANLRRSRHNFELIFEESPAMIAITSQKDGGILQINKAFGRTFGVSKAEARSLTMIDVGLWHSLEERDRYMAPVLDGHFLGEQEIELERPGGHIHLSTVIHPIMMEGELCYIVILWDITAQKHIEGQLVKERAQLSAQLAQQMDALRVANTELTRAMQVKDEFVANMSYELRAPLTAILGILEVMYAQNSEALTTKQLRYVQLIETSSRQLLEMINDILDLTRIGRQREELSIEKIILSEICRSSLMYVQQAANKKRIQLQYDLDPSLDYAYADPIRLKQILTNLLSNGVKFTPRGGMVGVRVIPSPDGRWIDFCVWDTGVGMDEALLEKVFQPFVQHEHDMGADEGETKNAGAGLGLTLVAQLTDLHSGTTQIDSVKGKGTRVTVSLPRERPHANPTYLSADFCDPDEAALRR